MFTLAVPPRSIRWVVISSAAPEDAVVADVSATIVRHVIIHERKYTVGSVGITAVSRN